MAVLQVSKLSESKVPMFQFEKEPRFRSKDDQEVLLYRGFGLIQRNLKLAKDVS